MAGATLKTRPAGPWLVGGPGRCGKTHLVLTMWAQRGIVAGFPLEGLITVYSRRWPPFTRRRSRSLLAEYLTRPRYIDAERDKSEAPLKYFSSKIEQLRSALPDSKRRPVEIIGWVLDRFAEENGGETWAAFDLHPEFGYRRFRRQLPGLKLAVMRRDPREAVCAALFWRGAPDGRQARDRRFKHSLIGYCLGLQTARRLARRWPDDVHCFDFNALIAGDGNELERVQSCFDLQAETLAEAYGITPYFHYQPGQGFLLPDGSREHLLEQTEMAEIFALSGIGTADASFGEQGRRSFLAFARAVLLLGRLTTPDAARLLSDLAYYPRRTVQRRINGLRQFASDLRQVSMRRVGAPDQLK